MLTTSNRTNSLSRIWADESSFATTLLVLFTDVYGTEGYSWDPETIQMEVQDDNQVQLPQANLDKLLVAINLVTSDYFFESLHDFVDFCNILAGGTYDPQQWDPADSAEIAWGITEALLIAPPDKKEPFTDEIRAYIGKVLSSEGIIHPPDVLQIALQDDPNVANSVYNEFSDDPDMFAGIYNLEQAKTSEVNQVIVSNLRALAMQLDALPLHGGDTSNVVQTMLRSFGQQEQADQADAPPPDNQGQAPPIDLDN